MEQIAERMRQCRLCPRQCGVNRLAGARGYCGMPAEIYVARAALHAWEEPCISGEAGSGTVFFSGCPLRCVYCQNRQIALGTMGQVVSVAQLATLFLRLQEQGALNLNLVTPTHYVPQIIAALQLARTDGLRLPVVYNTSSYETVETLRLLDGFVDIYLADLKYYDANLAARYSHAPDYFAVASAALAEMVRQVGAAEFDAAGIMQRGVIVRHLLLPGQTEDSKDIVSYLYRTYEDQIYLSLMNQYTPLAHVAEDSLLSQRISEEAYASVVDYAISLGVENGFVQEGETAIESFIPDFSEPLF